MKRTALKIIGILLIGVFISSNSGVASVVNFHQTDLYNKEAVKTPLMKNLAFTSFLAHQTISSLMTSAFLPDTNVLTSRQIPTLKPVNLQNVKYIYQQNVRKVDLSKFIEKDGAMLPPAGTNIVAGSVLVDESNRVSYLVVGKNSDGTLILRKPTMSEVFENFDIPKQTVNYNEANIIDLQPSIRNVRNGISNPTSLGKITIDKIPAKADSSTGTQQKVASLSSAKEKEDVNKALEKGWAYGFNNAKLDAYFEDGTKLSVTLSGIIKAKLGFNVDYSMFDGYEFGLVGGQVFGMKAAFDVKVKKEVYIPIVGIDMDFGIGGVRAGLFIVVGVDGDITLVVAAEEGTSFEAGLRGGTFFGVPTSFKPYSNPHAYYSAECDPNGQITAYAYLTPSVSVSVLGINVFKSEIRLGFNAYAREEGPLLNYGVNAVFQFIVGVCGKQKNVINSSFSLFSRKKEAPPGGFYFYGDLCAYRDDALIAVYRAKPAGEELPDFIKDPFADKVPYVGEVQLCYYKAGNTTAPFKTIKVPISVEEKGVMTYDFKNDGINVVKGDSYRIVIPGNNQAISSNYFATIPFKGIKLDKADFFNEVAFGQVMPVSAHRDKPGWALEDVKAEGKLEQLFCSNRTATVRYVDPKGKTKTISQSGSTDTQGKFKLENYDIRPNKKAVPYINIDGFEIEGNPIDTTAGIYFGIGTDYLSSPVIEKITYNSGVESKELVSTLDKIDYSQQISYERHTSGDHTVAVNEYGTKKIENTVDYNTKAYFVKDIEKLYSLAIAAAKAGATVDLRKWIMDNTGKQLFYTDHQSLPLNEANNSQTLLFEGEINDLAKKALQEGQPLSSSHAYHKVEVRDAKYFPMTVTRIPSAPVQIPIRRLVSEAKIQTTQDNCIDAQDPLQPKGVDATITLNMQGSPLTLGYATNAIYVDSKASIDIEGYRLFAEQADPWIMEGHKQSKEGKTPEQILKDEIDSYMKEGVLYFKRFVVNPVDFTNTKLGTWRPALGTVKHELIVDYSRNAVSIDGIKLNAGIQTSMLDRKLYLPAASLMQAMGGTASYDTKTGKLALLAANRSILIDSSSKAALAAGKSISIKADIKGSGKSTQLSTNAVAKLFNASVTIDTKKSVVKIGFKGN